MSRLETVLLAIAIVLAALLVVQWVRMDRALIRVTALRRRNEDLRVHLARAHDQARAALHARAQILDAWPVDVHVELPDSGGEEHARLRVNRVDVDPDRFVVSWGRTSNMAAHRGSWLGLRMLPPDVQTPPPAARRGASPMRTT